jgi:hypothetical protein
MFKKDGGAIEFAFGCQRTKTYPTGSYSEYFSRRYGYRVSICRGATL